MSFSHLRSIHVFVYVVMLMGVDVEIVVGYQLSQKCLEPRKANDVVTKRLVTP